MILARISDARDLLMMMQRRLRVRLVIVVSLACAISPAGAVDLLPEDGIAPKVGLHALQVRTVHNRYESFYKNGNEIAPSVKFSLDTLAVRYSTSFEALGRPNVVYVDAPLSNAKASNVPDAQSPGMGLGDTTFALAHWLLADHAKQHHAGIVGYVTLPTGRYDGRYTTNALGLNTNPGQNRWAAALQAGHFMRLFSGIGWLIAFDTAWFGENDDFRPTGTQTTLNRRPLYTWQTHFSKRVDDRLMLGVGYYWVSGGETKIANSYQGNAVNTQRYQLTGTYDLPGGYRLGLQYGANLKTRNGFDETGQLSLRFWRFF